MKILSKQGGFKLLFIFLSLILIGLIALLFINNNGNNYQRLDNEDEFDNYLIPSFINTIDKAIEERDYNICYEIPFDKSIIIGDMIISSEEYFIDCISEVASEIDNLEVCDKISDVFLTSMFAITYCKSDILIERAKINGVNECDNSDNQDSKDHCFAYFASNNSDSDLCKKIANNSERSKCAFMLGIEQKDISLCSMVIKKGSYSELSEYYYCLDAVVRNFEGLDVNICKQIAGIPLGNKGVLVYDQRDYCFYYLGKEDDPKYCSEIANWEVAIDCLKDGMYIGPSYYSKYLDSTYDDILSGKDLSEDKIYLNNNHGFKFVKPGDILVKEEFGYSNLIYLMSPENDYLFNENNRNCTDEDPETICNPSLNLAFIYIDIQEKPIGEGEKTNIKNIFINNISWQKYIRTGDIYENIVFETRNNDKYFKITSNYPELEVIEFLESFEFIK